MVARIGVLAGTRRAYLTRPWTYWLSPLADLPVTLEIMRRSRQKSHTWRGRTITSGELDMNRFDRKKLPWIVLVAHLGALVFGLIGLLIMLPNPDLWSSDPNAVKVFDWSMEHAGATHIVLRRNRHGTVRMVGHRLAQDRNLFSRSRPLFRFGFELFGTSTGWPFGNYAYTDFLGTKVFGHVPWTIPLSWFYMGLASYLIGTWIAQRLGGGRRAIWGVLAGAWMLTAWDLVLDPAMAHESLRVKFWVWDEQGPYFGMPVKNFAGWVATGLIFMAISRWIWREDAQLTLRD